MFMSLQRAGQRKKCASCHIVIHSGCMARLDQVSTIATAAAAANATDATDAGAQLRSVYFAHLI